ncbi:MAG: helix-turn-helix domain-containing protein [Alphaproteobacteria bacterium]|nr:helix-turn-helix domain-containing protein [Alphaproteobacteria bacterium]
MNFQKALYNVRDARAFLGGLSHSKFYALVREGSIELTKIGRRSYVTPQEIERFVRSLQSGRESCSDASAEAKTVRSGLVATPIEGGGDA